MAATEEVTGILDRRLALSPSETAEVLGVSRPSVYLLLADGRLPSVYCGARRLIAVAAVRAYLEGGHEKS